MSVKEFLEKTVYLALLIMGGLAGLLLPSGCAGADFFREAAYMPGSYTGTGRGYRGPITVQIETSLGGIEDIAVIDHRESAFPGGAAMEELLELVLETGSTDLDAVSGATFSSRGFLEAVDDALSKAYKRQ